jgi:LmbE family N-acetylglucosaminyl deacetylase
MVRRPPKDKAARSRWKKSSTRIVLLCLAAVLLGFGGIWLTFLKINSDYYHTLPALQVPQADRVLVIAPHCDDEMLNVSVLLKRLVDQGSKVYFVVITNGDGFTSDIVLSSRKLTLVGSDYIRLGQLRQRETLNGLALLGIPSEQIRFLGYADRGCQDMLLYHWYAKAPYFDPWTQSNYVSYENSFGNMPAEAGENIFRDLKTILKDVSPNLIIMPNPCDANADHAAVNAMMQFALGSLSMDGVPQLLYLTHHLFNTWPQPLYPGNAGPYLIPPADLRSVAGNWQVLPMTTAEKKLASTIIGQYRSQLVVDNRFLHSFVRDNELFSTMNQPKLPYGRNTGDRIQPTPDNLLISASPAGHGSGLSGSNGPIKALHAEISTDGFLHLMLVTDKPIDPRIIYQFTLISETNGGAVLHSTITVQNGQAYEVGLGCTIHSLQTDNSCIHITIPYADLKDIKTGIVKASVNSYERIVSETIWQALNFPAQ